MPPDLSLDDLEEFFEEVWQLSELAAGTEDEHVVPQLVALAEQIAAWRHELARDMRCPAIPLGQASTALRRDSEERVKETAGLAQDRAVGKEFRALRYDSQALRYDSQALRYESQAACKEAQAVWKEAQAVWKLSQAVCKEAQALRHESQALRHESQALSGQPMALYPRYGADRFNLEDR